MNRHVAMHVDPVCGMQVGEDTEFRTNFMGDEYYFCSGRDLAEFERDPIKYVSLEKAEQARAGIYTVKK